MRGAGLSVRSLDFEGSFSLQDKIHKQAFQVVKVHIFALHFLAKVAQLVEHDLAKVGVAGSNPVFRSSFLVMSTSDPR